MGGPSVRAMDEIIDYYNRLASDYDHNRFENSYGQFIDAQERKILNQLIQHRHGQVLDIACGTGRLMDYATQGLDASIEMLKIAQAKFPDKKMIQAQATTIPLEDKSLEVVFSFHFFMHLDRDTIVQIIQECHRLLKPKGRIIFDIPSAKRRSRKTPHATDHAWHGAQSMSLEELRLLLGERFEIKRTFGLLALPIHRFPSGIRRYLKGLDYFLANYVMKEYSSYLVLELVKK